MGFVDRFPEDFRYPNRGDLLEEKLEAEILDFGAIYRVDDEVQKLLPGDVVPIYTDRAPTGNQGRPRVVEDRAMALLGESLAVDGDIGMTAGFL